MKRNISGIYSITNTVNDKIYIGSAVCCKQRFIGHRHDFNKNKHNDRFQNFVNKYGIETLIFTIIEVVNDKNELINREQFWINNHESYNSKKGFNICKIAGSILGVEMPQTHKDACKKRMLDNKYRSGKKRSDREKKEIGERTKKMWEENPDKLKRMSNKISKLKKGVPIWDNKTHPMLGKIHPNRKIVLVYKDNILIDEILGTTEVAKKYNLDPAAISKVCNGVSKSTKGFTMKYK
jgi:group I intron endonuclease